MSTHTATVRGRNSGPDFLNPRYSREHTLHIDGGAVVPGSPSPGIVAPPRSNAAAVDPEEAIVASVARRTGAGACGVLRCQAHDQAR